MDIDSLMDAIRGRAALAPTLGYRVKFDLDGDGVILIDGTAAPAVLSNEDGSADATLTLSRATLAQLIDGTLDPAFAFMTGRLKVDGSMTAAMQLAQALEG